jgi:hypothetical protein
MKTTNKITSKDTRFWVAVISVWGCLLATGRYVIGSLIDNQLVANQTTIVIERPLNNELEMMPASGLDDDPSSKK